MWHKWQLIRAEQEIGRVYDDFKGWVEAPQTSLYYVCGANNCHKTKIKVITGHWTLDELKMRSQTWD